MKLSTKTINILKNFASINNSIVINEGNTISTMSTSRSIMGNATVDESFEKEFAIFDLSRLLSTVSLFKDPEINLNENFLTISEGNKKINYVYADPSVVVSPNKKKIQLPEVAVEFNLSSENLTDAMKALSVLGLPQIAIVGEEGKVKVQAVDTANPTGDVYSVDVGDTDKVFKAVFLASNLKLIPEDYTVRVSSKGISNFEGSTVNYFVAVEKSSTFG